MEEHAPLTFPRRVHRRATLPFRFYTSLLLQEATGLRAATLPQLVRLLREVPEGCLYYHTRYFLLQHHLADEPMNDFAFWVTKALGERPLGERLAGIDAMQLTLPALRERIIGLIEDYLREQPTAQLRFASEGEEFFFLTAIHVILPTPLTAWTLDEFAEGLERVSLHSIYFHLFDARLKLGCSTNDFTLWLDTEMGEPGLAKRIAELEPYTSTLPALQASLAALVRQRLAEMTANEDDGTHA
ncbi:MAG: hypothetical protein HYY15_01770 [Candidatus Omnitrophica bacterium]|nr:hypothetical protein [Candidatus Omnitrophota bacterium]